MEYLTIFGLCFRANSFETYEYPKLASYRNYNIERCRVACGRAFAREFLDNWSHSICPCCKRPMETAKSDYPGADEEGADEEHKNA